MFSRAEEGHKIEISEERIQEYSPVRSFNSLNVSPKMYSRLALQHEASNVDYGLARQSYAHGHSREVVYNERTGGIQPEQVDSEYSAPRVKQS